MDAIVVCGAREHNLKRVNVRIPRHKLVVVTGLSGSGKSSLALDTIYAEGQRRYVESLSPYARQFLAQMPKPAVDFIDGLSPAIAIDQKNAARNPRSTVGTVTEINDYLRLLYAHAGTVHCPLCGDAVRAMTVQDMVGHVLEQQEERRFAIVAPVLRAKKGNLNKELARLRREGFVRVRLDGEMRDLEEDIEVEGRAKHDLDVFVDRLTVRPTARSRLADSLEPP